MRIMLVLNCSQIFEMFPAWKNHPCQLWALEGPWSLWKETGPRTNKPTSRDTRSQGSRSPPHQAKLHGNTMFPEQIHRFASSLIPPNNGYIVVKVDGDRHSQVRWRFVFVNTWELRHLVCWWYGWWKKSQTTTWDGAKTPVNNGINYLSTGELIPDFWLPSTPSLVKLILQPLGTCQR